MRVLNKQKYLIIFVLFVLFVLSLYFCAHIFYINCKVYYHPKLIKKIIRQYNIKNLYLPSSYNNISAQINKINIDKETKYFLISGVNNFVGKDMLWINMVKKYGINKSTTFMPMSYITYNQDDMKRFEKEFDVYKIYILKKNIQRQEGLKITNNYDDIISEKEYCIIQELLQDPYLINGRKINMRFYILVICENNKINTYVYNDGFMYYTKKHFVNNTLDFDTNVTTGYIDRNVYNENPLTHKDFKKYLINKKIDDNIVFNRIYVLINKIFDSVNFKICKNFKFSNNVCFQLFGADIAINNNLIPQIMEINKGPDLDAKDTRDRNLKKKLIIDMFKKVGLICGGDNENFVTINDK
jgi:hypothetical protein